MHVCADWIEILHHAHQFINVKELSKQLNTLFEIRISSMLYCKVWTKYKQFFTKFLSNLHSARADFLFQALPMCSSRARRGVIYYKYSFRSYLYSTYDFCRYIGPLFPTNQLANVQNFISFCICTTICGWFNRQSHQKNLNDNIELNQFWNFKYSV